MTRCAAIAFISAWKCYVMIHCTVQVGLGQLGFLSPGYIPPAWYVHFQTTWFLEKMQCVNDEQIKVFNGVHESIKRYIALHWKKEKTIPHSTNKVLAWKKTIATNLENIAQACTIQWFSSARWIFPLPRRWLLCCLNASTGRIRTWLAMRSGDPCFMENWIKR